MKLKALLLALAVAGVSSSFALAEDGHGGGHDGDQHRSSTTTTTATAPSTTTTTTTTATATDATTPANCGRLELRGTLASVSPTSFTLVVRRTSDAGRLLVGQTVAIGVDAKTRVEWEGSGTLIGPNVGDQARVKALSCPGTTAGSTTLTARSVRAHGAEHDEHDGHDNRKSHK
jgi:hypothetical protein